MLFAIDFKTLFILKFLKNVYCIEIKQANYNYPIFEPSIFNEMKNIFFAIVTIVSFTAFQSCKKKIEPGRAEVKVLDSDGVSQEGVHVSLYCTEPSCVVAERGTTNSLGVFVQEFELPVVLRVRAVRYDSTITKIGLPPNQIEVIEVDSLCGEGFITVENNEVALETITILQCR